MHSIKLLAWFLLLINSKINIMKWLFSIILLIFICGSLSANQNYFNNVKDSSLLNISDDVTNQIAAAISAGDSKKLASFFNSSIDLTVPSGEGTYSKSQAEMIVRNFFSQSPPLSFKINQQGSSNEGTQFAIGTLVTKSTKFRTYILLKKTNGLMLIHQLQFEEE